MKTKIFVDFDGTIFNTMVFRDEMFKIFYKYGFNLDEIKKTYFDESLDYKYSPLGQLDRLFDIRKFEILEAKQDFIKLFETASKYLYNDTLGFLRETSKLSGFDLCLFTLGDIEFQKSKVENSDILKFFKEAYYTDIDKWIFLDKIVKKDEKFILIDDRLDNVREISKKYQKSVCLQILRRDVDNLDPTLNVKPFDGVKINQLADAMPLIFN